MIDLKVCWLNPLPRKLVSMNFNFQCGRELGETLLNISRAWEQADTSTSKTLVGKLPLLVGSLGGNAQSGKNGKICFLRLFAYKHSLWQGFCFDCYFSIRPAVGICWKEVPIHGTIWSRWTTKGILHFLPITVMSSKCKCNIRTFPKLFGP